MARVHERGGGIGVDAEQRVVAVAVAGVLVLRICTGIDLTLTKC